MYRVGIDIGSISINLIVMNKEGNILKSLYVRHKGRPIQVTKIILENLLNEYEIDSVAATGTGAKEISHLIGASFVNEIIWAYDYGARTRKRWPPKHDTILWYAKDPANYIFNYEDIERIPYMAPGLVSPEKVARGKTPTDTWWHSIVGTNSRERTGYPTQKPEGVIRRIIQASSHKGDIVLDFFAKGVKFYWRRTIIYTGAPGSF